MMILIAESAVLREDKDFFSDTGIFLFKFRTWASKGILEKTIFGWNMFTSGQTPM
jgi:hypothetical protein